MARRVVLAAFLALAGCSSVCDREVLPHKGDASKPEQLVDIVRYACANECWGTLYDLTSERTRQEYSYVKFRIGFPTLKAPGSEDLVKDLIARAQLDVISRWHWKPDGKWKLAILNVQRDGKLKDLNVVLVEEPNDDGKLEWHVALQEQVDRRVSFD